MHRTRGAAVVSSTSVIYVNAQFCFFMLMLYSIQIVACTGPCKAHMFGFYAPLYSCPVTVEVVTPECSVGYWDDRCHCKVIIIILFIYLRKYEFTSKRHSFNVLLPLLFLLVLDTKRTPGRSVCQMLHCVHQLVAYFFLSCERKAIT